MNIDGKEIGDKGGAKIAAMLAASTSVKKLSLKSCKLTVKTARALADAMAKNKSLVELDLCGTFVHCRRPMGPTGAVCLLHAVLSLLGVQ